MLHIYIYIYIYDISRLRVKSEKEGMSYSTYILIQSMINIMWEYVLFTLKTRLSLLFFYSHQSTIQQHTLPINPEESNTFIKVGVTRFVDWTTQVQQQNLIPVLRSRCEKVCKRWVQQWGLLYTAFNLRSLFVSGKWTYTIRNLVWSPT